MLSDNRKPHNGPGVFVQAGCALSSLEIPNLRKRRGIPVKVGQGGLLSVRSDI
jgi:hypothetical protein